jgi:hypothetical protein
MFLDDLIKPIEDLLEKWTDSGLIWVGVVVVICIAIYCFLKGKLF